MSHPQLEVGWYPRNRSSLLRGTFQGYVTTSNPGHDGEVHTCYWQTYYYYLYDQPTPRKLYVTISALALVSIISPS